MKKILQKLEYVDPLKTFLNQPVNNFKNLKFPVNWIF